MIDTPEDKVVEKVTYTISDRVAQKFGLWLGSTSASNNIIIIVIIFATLVLLGIGLFATRPFLRQASAPATVTPPASTSSPGAAPSAIVATFTCSNGRSITAAFSGSIVALSLSDGRHISLPRALSASGARYANPDESFVFWNKGNTAFITENGQNTYDGCVTSTGR